MKNSSTRIVAAVLLCIAVGCTPNADFARAVRDHVTPMKPVYEQGVVTFPGATDSDRAIYRRHMAELDRLLDAGEGKAAPQ